MTSPERISKMLDQKQKRDQAPGRLEASAESSRHLNPTTATKERRKQVPWTHQSLSENSRRWKPDGAGMTDNHRRRNPTPSRTGRREAAENPLPQETPADVTPGISGTQSLSAAQAPGEAAVYMLEDLFWVGSRRGCRAQRDKAQPKFPEPWRWARGGGDKAMCSTRREMQQSTAQSGVSPLADTPALQPHLRQEAGKTEREEEERVYARTYACMCTQAQPP